PQEKRLQHSLAPSICHLNYHGKQINLIDTPGYPDFIGRTLSILPAVDTMAIVINAQTGIEMLTQRMMETGAERKLCRIIIVNKMDAPETDLAGLLDQIQQEFGRECLPINLPVDAGASVVDCFFAPTDSSTDFSSIEQAHTRIIDQVVEVDEALMEIYLEQGADLSPEQLHDPFEKALREGHLIPVCFVSSNSGAGIEELLDIIVRLMPNPMEGNPPPFLKGDGPDAVPVKVVPDATQHVIAHIFKITVDPFVGRLGVFRIHQGTVNPGSQLYIGDARKPFKIAHLLRLQGKDHFEIQQGIPGDICAIAKVDEIHLDAVLHDSHDEDYYHLRSMVCPAPMHGLAVTPTRRGDEQKLSEALQKLVAEDPCIRVEHRVTLNETVLLGMGNFHLRVLLERMKEQYHIDVETRTPSIAYRETITTGAHGHHRHKKQTGGAGQFGEVSLRIEALKRGSGFEFVNKVVGGSIPTQFIPAVEKGVRQVLEGGAIAGHPLQDVRVTVYEGKHHPVDSKEIAFVSAGKKAFLVAVKKARPIILEPVANLKITAPDDAMGDITGDISGMRGWINGTTSLPNNRIEISGQVPLSELTNYPSKLKSITGGEGSYTMEFSHYDPVPPKAQQELTAAYKPQEEGD
ncbi:MAG: elongation factor G, partial [Gammaproteobacteria bacterium]|nr:elongation factor G [Gammaproteobacteria bacterium]